MQFPITRERLQNYRKNEAAEAYAKERINKAVSEICHQVENIAKTGRDQKFTYTLTRTNLTAQDLSADFGTVRPVLDDVLSKLRELFPDSTIQVDPLKTYILIDWS